MKIRNGFVSNSSSSSFTCDICGETCSGMDMGLSDAEMHECSGGHTICDSHIKNEIDYHNMTLKQKKEYCISIADWDYAIDKVKSIEDEDDLDNYYEENLVYGARYHLPKSNCPCCELESPASSEVMVYLLHCAGKSLDDIKVEMKDKFGNAEEMYKQIEK